MIGKRIALLAAIVGLLLACDVAGPAGEAARPLALVGFDVLPMTGAGPLADQTILVRYGRIEAIGPRASVRVPWDADRIEGRGRIVLPGLIDSHVHLTTRRMLRAFVARGVTTVRNMDGDARHLAWRGLIARDHWIGPEIVTSGPRLDGSPPTAPGSVVVEGSAAARRAVRRQAEAGYDFVKVYGGLSPEAYRAILREAGRFGMPVAGHVPLALGVEAAFASGQASIEHAEELTGTAPGGPHQRSIPLLVRSAQGSGSWICPTLVRHRIFSPRSVHHMHEELVRAMYDGGIGVLAGSDGAPGGLQAELLALEHAGLGIPDVLGSATREAARFLGREGQVGTVAVGLRADLLILSASPLEGLAALEEIEGVVLRGRWLAPDRLARLTASR